MITTPKTNRTDNNRVEFKVSIHKPTFDALMEYCNQYEMDPAYFAGFAIEKHLTFLGHATPITPVPLPKPSIDIDFTQERTRETFSDIMRKGQVE